jgi:hypothetical protein
MNPSTEMNDRPASGRKTSPVSSPGDALENHSQNLNEFVAAAGESLGKRLGRTSIDRLGETACDCP